MAIRYPDLSALGSANLALGEYDLAVDTDFFPDFNTASGRLALVQAIIRRWVTPRGQLIDDREYGEDLTQYVGADMVDRDVPRVVALACAEALKDERVVDITGEGELTDKGELNLSFTVEDGAGPFPFTVAVSSVAVTLLTIGEAA